MLGDGYCFMPNEVLYSEELTDKQKLLFCAISSLCAEKGYCWASNDYLAEKFGVDERTIRRNVADLYKSGFIEISVKNGNQREISLKEGVGQKCPGGRTKMSTPGGQKCPHIIISNNTTIKKKENIKRKFLEFVYLTDEEYNKLIEQYGNRVITEQIENLNNYIGQNGKDKYKSHYYTLLNWLKKAGIKKQQTKQQNEYEISEGVYDIDKLLNNLPS